RNAGKRWQQSFSRVARRSSLFRRRSAPSRRPGDAVLLAPARPRTCVELASRPANAGRLIHDIVITQKSHFKINKSKLNVAVGDYVYVKEDNGYFGIVENIEDEKTHLVIASVDFKELFKVEVLVESFYYPFRYSPLWPGLIFLNRSYS
ncbi:MAG TPA: hypothetical protein VLB84_13510, partial [Bacteroidia bacterium]|nr:hypothetical protein [Bacteroidia bacterium]